MPAPWQAFLVAEELNIPPHRARVTIPAETTRHHRGPVYPTALCPNPKMPTLRKLANSALTAAAKTKPLSLE
jgi:hypothetical protein